ncbi:SDR family oxidoreductase [Williamsia herbipolensis]|uniref:SDR family oxidoreductase n=1 Tax=Williamsia herbipolensis TaxID=1603258 RepID=A0AAU4JYH1_9NOCA|nr:SDR family oxidoreductase [Williamsia herbipolensis]
MRSERRHVLVTGASGTLGAEICRRVAGTGWDVTLVVRTRDARAAETARECQELGAQTTVVAADLADPGSAEFVVEHARATIPTPMAGLVHCAAHFTFARVGRLADDLHSDYLRSFDVNTHALLRLIDQCGRHMVDDGRIVALSSVNSVLGLPGSGAYAASKAAAEALIRTASRELGHRGITCNTVQLGLVDTPAAAAVTDAGVRDLYAMQSAVGRTGRAEDVAAQVSYLLSEQAGWMTGQTVRLDGGFQCR